MSSSMTILRFPLIVFLHSLLQLVIQSDRTAGLDVQIWYKNNYYRIKKEILYICHVVSASENVQNAQLGVMSLGFCTVK